jgi:hypothetical protein
MTGASLHEPREVLGIDGHISVVGPNDVLVVRIARTLTREEASAVLTQVRQVLGRNRCLLFDEQAELSVIRDASTTTSGAGTGSPTGNHQHTHKEQ